MTELNEFYLIEELKGLGVDKELIKKVVKKFNGCRIYIRKKQNEYEEIKAIYNQMKKAGVARGEIIKYLSDYFEKSENRIRVITKSQGSLFDGF